VKKSKNDFLGLESLGMDINQMVKDAKKHDDALRRYSKVHLDIGHSLGRILGIINDAIEELPKNHPGIRELMRSRDDLITLCNAMQWCMYKAMWPGLKPEGKDAEKALFALCKRIEKRYGGKP
jgi:hypothetical protein